MDRIHSELYLSCCPKHSQALINKQNAVVMGEGMSTYLHEDFSFFLLACTTTTLISHIEWICCF